MKILIKSTLQSIENDPNFKCSNQYRDFTHPQKNYGFPSAMVLQGAPVPRDDKEICPKELKLAGSCREGHRCRVSHFLQFQHDSAGKDSLLKKTIKCFRHFWLISEI